MSKIDKNIIDPTTLQVGSCYAMLYENILHAFVLIKERYEKRISVTYKLEEIKAYDYDIVQSLWDSQHKVVSYIPISKDMYNDVKQLAKEKNKIDATYRNRLLELAHEDKALRKYHL